MVPDRNNEFIFNQIEYYFLANMFLNGIWLIVWTQDSAKAFIAGTVIIIALLYTCFYIMMLSCRTELTTFEAVIIRGGFSIYAGWVTAATSLNFIYVKKASDSPAWIVNEDENDDKFQPEKE